MTDLNTKYYKVDTTSNKTLFITSRDREGLACALMVNYVDRYDITDISVPEKCFFYSNKEANVEICKILEGLDRIFNRCAMPSDMDLFEKYHLYSIRYNTFYVPENIIIMNIEPTKRTLGLLTKVFGDEPVHEFMYLVWYDKHEKTEAINWDDYDIPLITTFPLVKTVTEGFKVHIMDAVNMAYDNMEVFDEMPDEDEEPIATFVGTFVIETLGVSLVENPDNYIFFNKVIEKYKYPCEAFYEICKMLDCIDASYLEDRYEKYFKRVDGRK